MGERKSNINESLNIPYMYLDKEMNFYIIIGFQSGSFGMQIELDFVREQREDGGN